MNKIKLASGMVGIGLVGGLTAISANASVDSTTSKTATQVTPSQTQTDSSSETISSRTIQVKNGTLLACGAACSNI